MKNVHIRFDKNKGEHTTMTIFIRGANCGTLTMRQAEALWFNHIISSGCDTLNFNFVASGNGPNPDQKLIDQYAQELSIESGGNLP